MQRSRCDPLIVCTLLLWVDQEGCGRSTLYPWSALAWQHFCCKHCNVAMTCLSFAKAQPVESLLTCCRLRFYAAQGVPLFVRAIAVIAWVTSLSIVALVPVDVLDSLLGTSGSITGPLDVLWSISYWYTLTHGPWQPYAQR